MLEKKLLTREEALGKLAILEKQGAIRSRFWRMRSADWRSEHDEDNEYPAGS
jgi:hypothetical protein